MIRQYLILIASTLALVPCSMKADEPTPKETSQLQSNQVYVKIIVPTNPAVREKDQPVVESWIADAIKKLGQTKFNAVTGWVPLDLSPLEATDLWNGETEKERYCQAHASISDRTDGRVEIRILGWGPAFSEVIVSLKDEPGSRTITSVEEQKTELGMPFVAVLIGPPEKPVVDAPKK